MLLEPLKSTERSLNISTPNNVMASKLKAAAGSLERILLPRLNSIDGELKAINTRMDGMDKSITESDKRAESFRSEFRAELKTVHAKLDHIDSKLDIDRRMTIIETKMKEFEKES
jgi:hypothetical protein